MSRSHKLRLWLVDYGYMLCGALNTVLYKNPPTRYLEWAMQGKAPIILIPGILGKWSFMKTLGDALSKAGYPVYVVPELGYNLETVPLCAKAVKEVILKNNLHGVVLVAHSKGGLIGDYLLTHNNSDHRVLGMVAIATPFSGSAMATFIPLESFQELTPNSAVVHDLEQHHQVNKKIISIFPTYDNHVWSKQGSFLAGAENVQMSVFGHHRVLFDQKVIARVVLSVAKLAVR